MKKQAFNIAICAAGLVCMAIGITLSAKENAGVLKNIPHLPGLLTSLSFGALFSGLRRVRRCRALSKDPRAAKEFEIAAKDERNAAIRDKAKAQAFDFMLAAYAAMLMLLLLTNAETFALGVLTIVYLLFIAIYVYCASKYQKKM
ncbi:MAG: hypothetical protein LBU36_01975 [Clostridiales bacterium]|jgi:hypothetical protein|nr:hypothetical protein [Clostridiales bacterium]